MPFHVIGPDGQKYSRGAHALFFVGSTPTPGIVYCFMLLIAVFCGPFVRI
jgi:hypothetical protein